MIEEVNIKRQIHQDKQTLGTMSYNGKEVAKTLELPWRENKVRISCIPEGTYRVVRRTSPKYGQHFHITGVPNRSMILIHHGNYNFQINGCVLVGSKHKDINMDGYLDVIESQKTMNKLLTILPKTFKLIIE
jgi:hypothetical protein